MEPFGQVMARGGITALKKAGRFFMRDDEVFESLRRITSRLDEIGVPYAVVGGMALVAHGYDRTTNDVDILVESKGLEQIHARLDGLGYVRPFAGSKNLSDAITGTRIEFLISGQFPGDGKPKPVAFPDPREAISIDGIKFIPLQKLIELKLASGISAAHRAKDIGDVQELIHVLKLPRDFAEQLNPYVREKFLELWEAVAAAPPEE
jgi:hypothetical protein